MLMGCVIKNARAVGAAWNVARCNSSMKSHVASYERAPILVHAIVKHMACGHFDVTKS